MPRMLRSWLRWPQPPRYAMTERSTTFPYLYGQPQTTEPRQIWNNAGRLCSEWFPAQPMHRSYFIQWMPGSRFRPSYRWASQWAPRRLSSGNHAVDLLLICCHLEEIGKDYLTAHQ